MPEPPLNNTKSFECTKALIPTDDKIRGMGRFDIQFEKVMEKLLGALACSSRSNGWRACSSHLHQTHWMEGAPHDAKAMDVEEFTMEGSVQGILVKKIVKALKEVRPTFKRELLASRIRNSMWNLRQCAESLLKSSLQERFLDLLFIEERMSYLASHASYLGRVWEKLGLETLAYKTNF